MGECVRKLTLGMRCLNGEEVIIRGDYEDISLALNVVHSMVLAELNIL